MARVTKFVDPLTGVEVKVKTIKQFRPHMEDRPEVVDEAPVPPADATVKEILKWVGARRDRATLMLARESSGSARVTLIKALEGLLKEPTEGSETGEADESSDSTEDAGDGDSDDNADSDEDPGYADGDQGNIDGVEGNDNTDAQEA